MPGYIRFFAETHDGSSASRSALEYLHSVIRIAPVRLVSVTGELARPWRVFTRLLTTPMDGPLIANVVATSPEHWCRQLKIPMPDKDPLAAALATGKIAPVVAAEVARGSVELYTEGVRNILITESIPATADQMTTAMRYEAVITSSRSVQVGWPRDGVVPVHLMSPISHAALRIFVTGPT